MTNLAFDASDVMSFLLLRVAIIAGVVVLVALIVLGVVVLLHRRGKLGQARRVVEPMARSWGERGGPVRRAATRTALTGLDRFDRDDRDDRDDKDDRDDRNGR
ncbi:hypothetical protein [Amycolatopsis suaedae]|uniref:Uncharacterized protein n=1 Tax=Amycolatopsis suaedae TaxID=2510978 RepID=A0A4Q7J6P9_9PSEU|nr:hypothetical protein [Amycolatopsis suaedae]RZQ62817.1 hypothetical protein EWH70_17945 [Amycolatopsis suaedae]